MLINTFSLWACNEHLRTISENYLFDNYRNRFLWPQKLQTHRRWHEEREIVTRGKRAYVPITTEQQVQQIMALNGLVVYIDSHYRGIRLDNAFDITVTGVNSIKACAMAMEFVVNQLAGDDLPSQTCLALLPSVKKSFGKSLSH
tara:strand:+ start:697 stop:1128 length:432 start_codon:yes stop_codon:yes gene_type:complete